MLRFKRKVQHLGRVPVCEKAECDFVVASLAPAPVRLPLVHAGPSQINHSQGPVKERQDADRIYSVRRRSRRINIANATRKSVLHRLADCLGNLSR